MMPSIGRSSHVDEVRHYRTHAEKLRQLDMLKTRLANWKDRESASLRASLVEKIAKLEAELA
jgi:hypothetical protein